MQEQSTAKTKRMRSVLKFALFPPLLAVVVLAILAAAIIPLAQPYMAMADTFFMDSAPKFDQESAPSVTSADQVVAGSKYGRVVIDSVGIDVPLYYDDSPAELEKGVGTYIDESLPGEGGTVLLAGHNYSFFSQFDKVKVGDKVVLDTDYGDFAYEVEDLITTKFDDLSKINFVQKKENLILYTCAGEPLFSSATERLFVIAKYLPQ